MVAHVGDVLLVHQPLVVLHFHRVERVFVDLVHVGHQGDGGFALVGHQLGHGHAREVTLAVEHHDAIAGRLAVHHLLGRAHVGQRGVGSRDRLVNLGAHAVGRPVRAGRDHHLVGAVGKHVVGVHLADTEMDLDILELAELDFPVGDHAAPFGAARVARHPFPVPAQFLVGLAQMDVVTAHAQHPGAFHPRRPAAHDEHRARLVRLLELLGMPAAPVFLARGCVLGAAQKSLLLHARDAHVAPDAFADVLVAPLLDLFGQERVGDRGPRRADNVALAVVDHADHVVGAGEAAVVHDRYVADDPLHVLDEGLHPVRLAKARAGRVLARPLLVIADLDRPGVEQPLGVEELDDGEPLLEILQREGAQNVVGFVADRDRARRAAGLAHLGEALDGKTQPVLERAAPAVAPVIVAMVEKLRRHRIVARGQLEDIEARILRPLGREHIHIQQRPDVVLVAFGAEHRALGKHVRRQAAGIARHLAGLHVRCVTARVPELDARQRAVPVQLVAHMAVIDDVALVPHPPQRERVFVRFRVHRDRLGEHRAPAALGLGAAKRGLGAGPLGAESRAMGGLPETVFQCLGAELDGLEQNVILRFPCHDPSPRVLGALHASIATI